jgi:hypothetical protein
MSKIMAQLNDDGVIVNVITAQPATPDTPTLVSVPEGQRASIGGDIVKGVFYPAQPYPSWTRGKTEWEPPVAKPENALVWDEQAGDWIVAEA